MQSFPYRIAVALIKEPWHRFNVLSLKRANLGLRFNPPSVAIRGLKIAVVSALTDLLNRFFGINIRLATDFAGDAINFTPGR